MTWVSLLCVILGAILLLAQFGLALMGLGPERDETDALLSTDESIEAARVHDVETKGADTESAGVLAVHTIAAGLVFFGLAGLAATALGWSQLLAALLAATFGILAFWTVRQVQRSGRLNNSESRAA